MASPRYSFALAVAGLAIIGAACSGDAAGGSAIEEFALGTPSQSSIGNGELLTILDSATGNELGAWTLPIGSRPEESITIGDTVLVPYMENASGTGVVALEAGTGPLWQYEVPGYGFGVLQRLDDDIVLGVIAYEDAYEGEQVPLGSSWLGRIDAETGESVWSAEYGTLTGLAVRDDLVVMAVDGEIRALDGASGEQVWSTDFGFEIGPTVIDGQILAIGTDRNGTTHYITLSADGDVVGDLAVERYLGSSVDIDGSRLIFTSRDRTFAYDIESGEEVWTTRGWQVHAAGRQTLVRNAKRVKAIDPTNGELLWRTPAVQGRLGSVAATGGRVYAAHSIDEEGRRLIAFTTGPDSAVDWRVRVPGAWGATTADDELVAIGGDGFVNAYDPGSGEQLWSAETANPAGPITIHDDTILVFGTIPATAP